jgi:hypothetical protein
MAVSANLPGLYKHQNKVKNKEAADLFSGFLFSGVQTVFKMKFGTV